MYLPVLPFPFEVQCIEGVLRADREGHLKIFWLDNKFQSPSALGYRDVNLGVGLQVRNLAQHRTQALRAEYRAAECGSNTRAAKHHWTLCFDFEHAW